MAVAPLQAHGVVADLRDAAQLEVASAAVLDLARVPLAAGTGAQPPEYVVRVDALVAIGPLHLHLARAMRRLDADRSRIIVRAHRPNLGRPRFRCKHFVGRSPSALACLA